jgi:predicted AAA+ superfamily ATPase
MQTIHRQIVPLLHSALRRFPAVVITGPRRSGKTTLLRTALPHAQYVLLEDPDIQDRIRRDPRSFHREPAPPVIFDEIQNTPQLLDYVRTLVDARPRKMGQWLFTGSQEAPLMQGITESMAGRAAILQLLPFSWRRRPRPILLLGGFPEVVLRPRGRELWFASYLQTYIERDVRLITNVRDLPAFAASSRCSPAATARCSTARSCRPARRHRADHLRVAAHPGNHRPDHSRAALL